jgi:hypothetical protein
VIVRVSSDVEEVERWVEEDVTGEGRSGMQEMRVVVLCTLWLYVNNVNIR